MQLINNYIPKYIECPYFLTEDKIETMQRYRIFINTYNEKVAKLNREVKQYNSKVVSFIKKHDLQGQAEIAQENFERQKAKETRSKWLSISKYNALIEKTNGTMLLLKKQKHISVKQSQETTFEVILWLYSQQLISLRKHLQKLSSGVKVAFPKVQTTSTRISNFKKEGVRRVLYCKETIQNHIHRLREAGVFVEYQFKGTKKPVEYFINEAIFVFRDNQKKSNDNQLVSDFLPKKVPYKSVDTRTNKEIIKKVGNVDNHSQESEGIPFADGKNKSCNKITEQDKHQKKSNQYAGKLGARENFPKNHLSEYLRGQIQHRTAFLQALTEHHYDSYSFSAASMNRRLDKEATNGAMSKEEFRELLLQQFLKIAAPIWKGKDVYYGSWHNALTQLDDECLRNPNGSIPRKQTQLYMFGFLIYRINRAKRFFRKKEQYQIHFPCIYFDATRKRASEGGFAYTLEWLKQYQKYQEQRILRKQQNATKAGTRRRTMTAEEKVRAKIKQYVKGKMTLPQVYHYIEQNKGIPNYFVSEVPRILNTITHKEFDLYAK